MSILLHPLIISFIALQCYDLNSEMFTIFVIHQINQYVTKVRYLVVLKSPLCLAQKITEMLF